MQPLWVYLIISHICYGKIRKGDSLDIYVLASGSKGNITCIRTEGFTFYVDAGISYQKIRGKMDAYGLDIGTVRTVFLTHEHGDHTAGLRMLMRHGLLETVFLTRGTYARLPEAIKDVLPEDIRIVRADEPFVHMDVKVTPFTISHDAAEPVGYVFESEGRKIVHLTDTGYVHESYLDLLRDADVYIVEANHHVKKLMDSYRPFPLKNRIKGELGHLSNEDACWVMNKVIVRPAVWVVAHMSEDCNSVLDIEEAIVSVFDDPTKVRVMYASQESLPVIVL
jgi:phosphoribosyl 1,2-cyclic phosphodiesterase